MLYKPKNYFQKEALCNDFTVELTMGQSKVGVNLYRERKWNVAKEYFEKILELDPNDKPSQKYLRRCNEYLPPPGDWDGAFELRSK